ncbi:DUF4148 domain-containing protein [Methylibium sp.]|uniref:DUF4148 domain-containing protein n=1 Tax=Methylibium sp. TaxID=2067992 RepID=UPI003D0CD420
MKLNRITGLLVLAAAASVTVAHASPGKTRDEVKAELAEAIRTGNISAGNTSLTLRELFPQRYPSQAAATPLTREQVRAELAEAIRTGEIRSFEGSASLRELNPGAYPARPEAPGLTRAQVRAELAEAIRTGDIVGNGDSGRKLNELWPNLYPKTTMSSMPQAQQVGALNGPSVDGSSQ